MIALPGQLFYTTQIPVCLWFITKNKKQRPHPENPEIQFRDRSGETLFIDARQLGTMIDRTQKELTKDDIDRIASTYHNWRNVIASDEGAKQSPDEKDGHAALAMTKAYEDQPGFCKSATRSEIAANDYVLTPGRYVGIAEEEEDGELFEEKMSALTATLKAQLTQAKELDQAILENLKGLGYE